MRDDVGMCPNSAGRKPFSSLEAANRHQIDKVTQTGSAIDDGLRFTKFVERLARRAADSQIDSK